MRGCFKILMVGLVVAGTLPVPAAQAAGKNRVLAREQVVPAKGDTCKPKWPYVMLICVA